MQNTEKLCLRWNDFKENVNSAFGKLRDDKDLLDVTLVCEDGNQVEAHKVILAASSPFFMEILKRNKHPHPLIYMRGFKSRDLVAIIDFLYFGEAKVFQENFDSFLAIAEELRLKGLTGTETSGESGEPTSKSEPILKNVSQKREKAHQSQPLPDDAYQQQSNPGKVVAVQEKQVILAFKILMSRSDQ